MCGRCSDTCLRRTIVLMIACLAKLVSGAMFVYNAYEISLKKIFGYTQYEVNVIGALYVIGSSMIILPGLMVDKLGPKWTCLVGFVLTTLGYGLIFSAVSTVAFYHNKPGLLGFFFCIAGHGGIYMYISALATVLKSYPPKHRGKVVGLMDAFFGGSGMVFSSIYINSFVNGHVTDEENQNLKGFVVLLWITSSLCSLLCVFFLRVIPYEDESYLVNDNYELTHGKRKESATEATELIEDDSDISKPICETRQFFSVPFQTLLWSFIFIASSNIMFVASLSAITKSVYFEDYDWGLFLTFGGAGLVARLIIAPLSDLLIEKVPRIVYIILGCILAFIGFLMFLFGLDILGIFYSGTVFAGISISMMYIFVPTIISESFGNYHLGFYFGLFKLFSGAAEFATQATYGAIYDSKIPNKTNDETECYGVECSQGSMGLGVCLSGMAIITSIIFLVNTKNNVITKTSTGAAQT